MSSPAGSYSIPVSLDAGGKATRNLSVVVSRSHVQTMALPSDFNIVALTVQPESTLIGDIFKFSGPDRLSIVDDPKSNVFFVNAWDPKGEVPIDQRAGTPATLFPTDRLVPGQGYMVFVVNLDTLQPPRDHALIIPGSPLLDSGVGTGADPNDWTGTLNISGTDAANGLPILGLPARYLQKVCKQSGGVPFL